MLGLEIYKRRNFFGKLKWHWRYKAPNGKTIANSQSSGYHNLEDCKVNVEIVGSLMGALTREKIDASVKK